jgi:hypothetical protein
MECVAVAGGWEIYPLSQFCSSSWSYRSEAGFDPYVADRVCRGYTLITRVTHGLDRDLVPLTMEYQRLGAIGWLEGSEP